MGRNLLTERQNQVNQVNQVNQDNNDKEALVTQAKNQVQQPVNVNLQGVNAPEFQKTFNQAPSQGFNQGSTKSSFGQGFAPATASQGFAPASQGFAPASQGFAPASQGFAPATTPVSQGFSQPAQDQVSEMENAYEAKPISLPTHEDGLDDSEMELTSSHVVEDPHSMSDEEWENQDNVYKEPEWKREARLSTFEEGDAWGNVEATNVEVSEVEEEEEDPCQELEQEVLEEETLFNYDEIEEEQVDVVEETQDFEEEDEDFYKTPLKSGEGFLEDCSIEDDYLRLPTRTLKAFQVAGFEKFGDIKGMTKGELRSLKGFGPSGLKDLIELLKEEGAENWISRKRKKKVVEEPVVEEITDAIEVDDNNGSDDVSDSSEEEEVIVETEVFESKLVEELEKELGSVAEEILDIVGPIVEDDEEFYFKEELSIEYLQATIKSREEQIALLKKEIEQLKDNQVATKKILRKTLIIGGSCSKSRSSITFEEAYQDLIDGICLASAVPNISLVEYGRGWGLLASAVKDKGWPEGIDCLLVSSAYLQKPEVVMVLAELADDVITCR